MRPPSLGAYNGPRRTSIERGEWRREEAEEENGRRADAERNMTGSQALLVQEGGRMPQAQDEKQKCRPDEPLGLERRIGEHGHSHARTGPPVTAFGECVEHVASVELAHRNEVEPLYEKSEPGREEHGILEERLDPAGISQEEDLEDPIGQGQMHIHAQVRRGVVSRPGCEKPRHGCQDACQESPEGSPHTHFHEDTARRDGPLQTDERPEGAELEDRGTGEEIGPGDPDSVSPGREEVPHFVHREDEEQGQGEGRACP